ncbi:MAG: TIGR02710 family CRISPR-associated CARF protein [Patescibacteria group bacterium]|nr:TIGR02710 family CRISPR-associated CARF protein [Patescibacteria group bacterium]
MKALVISVGTGVGKTRATSENLAKALSFSIAQHNPDTTFFVASKESEKTVSQIIKQSHIDKYEVITIENPDDTQAIYETLEPKFKQITKIYNHVTVDYTSGTKAMTAALAILATTYEVAALSYVAGKREGGIVKQGTEQLKIIKPYFATTEKKRNIAVHMFNNNQFNATITIIKTIEKTTADPTITNKTKTLKMLAKAYAEWDKFNHQRAFALIKKISMTELSLNKKFLGQLLNSKQPEPYYIVDLLNNAKRRGMEEQKYDDATARLYRTIELIGQYQLKAKYGIHTSEVSPNQLPEKLRQEWGINLTTEPIKIGLQRAYELLAAKNDEIGKKFLADNKLKDLLNKRNTSILAHDLKPVDKQTYTQLYKKVTEYAQTVVPNLHMLQKEATFIKLTRN